MGNFYTTTNPSPPLLLQNFIFTVTDDFKLLDPLATYTLTFDGNTFTTYTVALDGSSITFTNVVSSHTGSIPYLLVDNYGNTYEDIVTINDVCFQIGTKILCKDDIYINIEDIEIGTEVKTYRDDYKKVLYIKKGKHIINKKSSKIQCMYKLTKNKIFHNVPFEDLIITGGHSILVDNFSQDEIIKTKEIWNELKKIDDKYLLLACVGEYFTKSEDILETETYHIVLESDDIHKQYGIYANGVLTETLPIHTYIKNYL